MTSDLHPPGGPTFAPPPPGGLGVRNPGLGLTPAQLLSQTPLARTSQPDKERQLLKIFIIAPEEQADLLLQLPQRWLDDAVCQRVFSACHELADTGRAVNMHSVVDQIKVQFAPQEQESLLLGYAALLREPVLDTTENLLIEVRKAYQCRVLYKDVLQDLNRQFLRNEPIEDLYDKATKLLLGAEQETSRRPPLAQVLESCYQDIMSPPEQAQGLATGLKEFDQTLGGIIPDRMIVYAGLTGQGKCLGYGTKVMMYDGTFKEVQSIVIGDQLMGPDSTPRNVLSTCTGTEQMYWIRQRKGIDYRVNESHILTLRETSQTRPIRKGSVIVNGVRKRVTLGRQPHEARILDISVRELLTKGRSFLRNQWKGFKAPGVEFQHVPELHIQPYYLGLWLGDGASATPARITTVEPEIETAVESYATELNMRYRKLENANRTPTLTITAGDNGQQSPLWKAFRRYGLINNKHIPSDFLVSSRESRLLLLAGLLDTDGYYSQGKYEIVQKSETLAKGIISLARSLGFYVYSKLKIATMKRQDGTVYSCPVHRISICGNDLSVIPCKVERKKAIASTRLPDVLATGISIEKDVVDNYYGFTIDGDHRFLLEDLTVTHNTAAVVDLVDRALSRHRDKLAVLIISLEMSEARIVGRLFARKASVTTDRMRDHAKPGHTPLQPTERARLYDAHQEIRQWVSEGSLEIHYGTTTAAQIRQLGRRFCLKHQAQGKQVLVAIDHLGMVEHSGRSSDNIRSEFINSMKAIKSLQMDFGATTVPLVQLVKSVKSEGRKDTWFRPHTGDIAESGFIEQTADSLLLWWRPEQYCAELGRTSMHYGNNPDWAPQGRTIGIVGKNRDGQSGIDLVFDSRVQFSELQDCSRLDFM